MEQEMTMQEIEERFDGEWVLIGDPETNHEHHVLKGRVLFHSKDRDEMDRYALSLRGGAIRSFASFYIGEIPVGTAVLL